MEEPLPPPTLADAPDDPHSKGLIGSLTDFSFESFVTPTLVRYLYGLALLVVGGYIVYWIVEGGFSGIIWRIVFSPLLFVVGAILGRVFVEIIMVLFKILELLRRFDAERRNSTPKV